jgi:cytoskeletal protein CcmA (bactofilin family)
MLTRKPDRGSTADDGPPPLPGHGRPDTRTTPPRRPTGVASVIGADLLITGNLETTGEIRIEGELQGDVRAGRIVVGDQAVVTGVLVAEEIVIGGNVQGSIRGDKVTFQAASHIEADVYHRSLAIEQGAYFEGKSRRSDNPMAVE